ncbi:hypothetical protein JAAARDRAFT_194789 [Jaapia argillacea MUCL 33604]|uniref:Uncharacterized protein n=1 Tax=Jaapia argillacea MUCL 33604 TaxID=933084 RepID=A0A067PPV5_9AGAM|nr:hypothetical protein JAAARDRAFT_194789 [Jaapia argillacea MUCL 33604]
MCNPHNNFLPNYAGDVWAPVIALMMQVDGLSKEAAVVSLTAIWTATHKPAVHAWDAQVALDNTADHAAADAGHLAVEEAKMVKGESGTRRCCQEVPHLGCQLCGPFLFFSPPL